MRYNQIIESIDSEISMATQAHDLAMRVINSIYSGDAKIQHWVEVSGMGEYYLYSPKSVGIDKEFPDMAFLVGLKNPRAIGNSGGAWNFSSPVLGYTRAVSINGMSKMSEDAAKNLLNSTSAIAILRHEFMHVLDMKRTSGDIIQSGKISDASNRKEYYNDPSEFNAYYHDIADVLIGVIRDSQGNTINELADLYGITGDFRTDLITMMNQDIHTRAFVKWLSDDNRKSFLRRLYRLHARVVEMMKAEREKPETETMTEGRMLMRSPSVSVIENPSATQARVLVEQCIRYGKDMNESNPQAYLRGLMIDGKRVVVWNGWVFTHEDVLSRFFPDVAGHSSDLTTFEGGTEHNEIKTVKFGDYGINQNPFIANLMLAVQGMVVNEWIDLVENTLPTYPAVLRDEHEIAEYIVIHSSSHVDEEFVEEYYKNSHAKLRLIPAAELEEGEADHNIPSKAKHRRYMKMSSETIPPLVVSDGKIEDGNHRFRVGLEQGLQAFWCYEVLEGKL